MGYDGVVVVGTKLDTKDFEAEINYVERKLNDMIADYQTLSEEKGFKEQSNQAIELRKNIQKVSNQLNDLKEKQKKINQVGLPNLKEIMENIGKSTKQTIKSIGRWALAIFSLRSAYMLIRNAINTIAGDDEQLKADIDYMKNALAYSLEPIIRKIVELMKQSMFYIAYISKAWTGRNIFENANKSLANANKNAQKLRKTLAGFDEMNVLNDNGTTGTMGALPSIDLSQMQGEVPEWIKWIAENKDIILSTLFGIGVALATWKIQDLLVAGKVIKKVDVAKIVGIGTAVAGITYAVQGLLKYLEDPSWTNFGQIIQGIGIAITGLGIAFLGLPAIVTGVVVGIVGTIIRYWEEIKGVLIRAGDWLEGSIESVYNVFGNTIGRIYEAFVGMFKGIVIGFDEVFRGIKQVLDGIIGIVMGAFTGDWKRAWQGVVDVFSGIFIAVVGIFRTVVTTIGGMAVAVGTTVGNVIAGTFKAVVNGVLWAIENILNTPIKHINSLVKTINKVPGINLSTLKTFNLPKLAVGGIVNMPGRGVPIGGAITGEVSKEGVLPLTDSQAMEELGATIGRYITINANITNTMNGRVISREIKKINANNDFALNR